MKVLLVRERYGHHTPNSGYDILFNDLQKPGYIHLYLSFRHLKLKKAINKILTILLPKIFDSRFYRFEHFWQECKIARDIIKHKPDVVHISHAHEQYKILTKKYFRSKVAFVGTIHMPFAFWKAGRRRKDWFGFYDKIIVLDRYSQKTFGEYLNREIDYVPHPLDTKYYVPTVSAEQKRQKPAFECFFAGRFLRDIDMVLEIARKLYVKDPGIIFHIAYPLTYSPEQLYYKMIGVISLSSVRFYNRVSNAQLLKFYHEADVVVMPLFESTANNVFLEAAACNTIPVTTKTNGTPSYLPEGLKNVIGNLNTADDIVDMVIRLKTDAALYKTVSEELGAFVRANFAVEKMCDETVALYKSVLKPAQV